MQMENEYMRKSTSLIIREMKIRIIVRYDLTLVRMAIIKKTITNKCWQGYGKTETFVHCWWECKLFPPLWKALWNFLKKLKINLPCDLAIPQWSIYSKKMETLSCKNVFILMLISALLMDE